MVLTACTHNNYFANIPQSYDRIFLKLICKAIPIAVYQDTRIRLRALTWVSNPIDPFCPNCNSAIRDKLTSMDWPSRLIDTIFGDLRTKLNEKAESMKQSKLERTKHGGEETGIIVNLDVEVKWHSDIPFSCLEELEGFLSQALDAGRLDVSETTSRPYPAAKSVVDELERVDMVADSDVMTKEDNCVVCLERLLVKEKKIVKLPCKHEFHEDCIVEWFSSNHVCPLCRFELPIEDSN